MLDDYAHHPTELAATIAAARELTDGRLVVLFQPHLFSRTLYLAREFADALAGADAACITDIYAAREEPIAGVTGKLLVERLCERRPGMPVGWAPTPGRCGRDSSRRRRGRVGSSSPPAQATSTRSCRMLLEALR